MPLVKSASNAARETNVKREIEAGKKPSQAVAISYSVQRQAGREEKHPRMSKRK